jgi:hypothetical protein
MIRIDRNVVLEVTDTARSSSFKLFFHDFADAAEAADTIGGYIASDDSVEFVIRSRREEDAR